MASCITSTFGSSYCPQAQLTVTQSSSTDTTVTLSYTLQYVCHGYAAYTNGNARAWSIVIDGTTVRSGSYNINGVSSTVTLATGTTTVSKTTSTRNVSFSCSFNFDITWSGTYGGTKTASSTISIGAKTSYTIAYNANGGSGAPSSQTKWYGTTLTLSSTKPTRTGYSFNKWNTNSGGTGTSYAAGASYTANAKATLYAQWKANTYTVSYNANGGSGAPSSQTKTYGVSLTLSSTKPTRTNYNFKGWGTSASATTVSYAAGASYTKNAAITLYAVWELAYWKPKITNFSVVRCTSDGTADNFGTYALVKFNWELCQLLGTNNISSIKIVCNSVTTTVSASGTSGSVSQVVGAGALSIEDSYTVEVTVTDTIQSGSTSNTKTIASSSFPIDLLSGGKGVAFGKPAEKENTVDSEWEVLSRCTDIGFTHEHGTTGNLAGFGVGSGGKNRGIWVENADADGRGWLVCTNGTDDTVYKGFNPDGELRGLVRLTSSNSLHVGYDGYDNSEGAAYYSGNKVYLRSKGGIYVTDTTSGLSNRAYGVNKVLWSGALYMIAEHTATLSEAVSKQPHGVVLAWSQYSDGSAQNSGWSYFFVPKHRIAAGHTGGGLNCYTGHYGGGSIMAKYVYVKDTTVVGNDLNYSSANNSKFVLRYVIGV